MQGIGAGVAQAAGGQPQPGQPPAQGVQDPQEEMPNVSPEEQAAYEQFVRNGLEVIYPKGEQSGVNPVILNHLKGQFEPEAKQLLEAVDPPFQGSPEDSLAATAVLLALMLEASAEQSGTQVADEIVMHGGVAILEELVQVAEASGAGEMAQEQVEMATYRAFDMYRQISPRIRPEELAAEFEQVVAADKAGQLDQIVPGAGAKMGA